ncbi:Ig-like domain-containing protein [Curtobacterium sp. 22159]|uniref:Ig-like domain-containing protein n=1 Tax=Curtobacterium sp. 22159 TaxID=3453882 RepID=UPI003F87147F
MNTRGENVDERAVGGDGPVRRTRTTVLVSIAAALVAALLWGAALPAVAVATDPGAEPQPTSTPDPLRQLTPVPGPPTSSPARPARLTIADPGDITSSTVRFSGTGAAGHVLQVTGPAATGRAGCSATVQGDGSWSCMATVRSGPQQVFTVQDRSAPELGAASTPASDVIVPPVVTTSRPSNGPVSGTGRAGSTITLSASGSTTDRTTLVGSDGRWTVSFGGSTPATGTRITVTATQTASTAGGYRSDLRSAASSPVTITLDRAAPSAPRITTPQDGSSVRAQPLTVSGTGAADAVLTVYVDRAPVCRAHVAASGRWSCSTSGSTLRPGAHELTALQQDQAGNSSRTSPVVRIDVPRASSTAPTGSTGQPSGVPSGSGGSSPSDGSNGNGGSGGSGHAGGHANGAGPDRTGDTTAPGSGAPGHDGGAGPGSAAGVGRGAHGDGLDWSGPAGDWTAPTAYDHTVPTIQAAFSWRTVLIATAVAAGFLVLVVGPLALVAAARADGAGAARPFRGPVRSPFARLLGRNRPGEERRRGDVLPTWASITMAFLFVGLCTILGVGVSLEARYVRLAVAVLLGAAVTTTTVVLASRWAAGGDRGTIGFRVSPWLVLAALVACGTTRSFDLSPAVVVGAVLVPVGRPDLDTGALRLGSTIANGARSATWRSVALLVVAAAGWVLHSTTPTTGFWGSFSSEFAITLCVGGLGAVVVTLLPFVGSAGHSLLAESRGRYVAIAAVAVALAAAVYSGTDGTHVSPVALAVVAAGCGAAAVVARLWLGRVRVEGP